MTSVPAPGQIIAGKYEVKRVLGEGARGVVVEALHVKLGQRFALKFLHPSLIGNAVIVSRFEREARNAAALGSVHAARVFDVDQNEGLPFVVVELLEGRNLADEVKASGPLPVEQAVDWVRQCCAAIAEAHERGIVHRNIKASNVFLAEDGPYLVAKMLDFGVSRAQDCSDVTEVGAVLGSSRWMSPEQISDPASIDARTDIWALGVLLFHLLTAKYPFDPDDTILAPASVRKKRPEVPVGLDAEIARTLEKEPSQRYATVKQLAAALAPYGSARVSAELESSPCLIKSAPEPTKSHGKPRTNLTAMTTRFFGRSADVERLEGLMSEGRRILTLLGPAGAGKTRLARRLAEAHVMSHEGGVWFCDLTEARDLNGVLVAVGHAVEAPLAGTPTEHNAVERLAQSIAARGSTLLVLDNCEQVIEAAARVITRIAELAPDAIQIATSRERLRVPGEQVHLVSSLEIEARGALTSDATRLFIDRAQSVVSGYVPGKEDIANIVELVRQLDGLPLAIELAAARMSVLGVQEIRARLEERFSLLSNGPRFAAERQRTMRGAIDWSWDLLGASERGVLAQCAVFRGGFGLAAAEGVIDSGDLPVLDVLQSLCEKSLLSSTDVPDLGERRYRFYESIRAYAFGKLGDGGETTRVLDRHMHYFATQGVRWAEAASKGESAEPRARLAVELENLRAAHHHALSLAQARVPGAANAAFTLLHPIAALLLIRGPIDLLRSLLDATLVDSITTRADASLVGEALRERARAIWFAPNTATAKIADLTRALEIAHHVKDIPLELRCHNAFASLELLRGHPDVARKHANAAIDRARQIGDKRALATAYANLGACDLAVERVEQARVSLEQALSLSRTTGDSLQTALSLARLSETLLQLDRLDEANACADDGFALASPFDAHRLLALLSALRGMIAHQRGNLPVARTRFDETLDFVEKAGAELLHHFYGSCRASVLADLDEIEMARAAIEATEARLPRFAEGPMLAVAVSISRGHLDLALARAAEKLGDAEAALAHRARAVKRIAALDQAEPFDDLRAMRRRLERAIARATSRLGLAASHDVREDAFVVAEDGSWFRIPNGSPINLSQRPHLCRVLLSLTLHRIGASGQPLSPDEVFRSGWPGEQVSESSAANRVRVALARLRKLGMRDVLLTKGGYMLHPDIPVVIVRHHDAQSPVEMRMGHRA